MGLAQGVVVLLGPEIPVLLTRGDLPCEGTGSEGRMLSLALSVVLVTVLPSPRQ